MKVLLVYPEYPNTFWSFKNIMKFVGKKATFPPLGLLTVASLFPDHFEKKLVDMNVSSLQDSDIIWSDTVMISAMEVQKESVKDVIFRCSRFNKRIIAGGPLFTTQPDLIQGIDHLILDEAETTLFRFLHDLENNKTRRIYTSKKRPDIKKVPPPSWDLIDISNYTTMLVQYSRGCPFNCDFCDIAYLNGRYPRTKSTDQIIEEIRILHDIGWRNAIFFVDDNFIGNKKAVKEMLPHLIKWQEINEYPFTFLTEASLDLADDPDLLDMMSKANFNKVFLGIETPNVSSLEECNKIQNISRNMEDSIKVIQGYGIEVMGGFIVGFDNDPKNIFQDQIEFIQKTGIVTAMVGLLNAIPETPLWERLKKEGRIDSESSGSNTDGTINFIPKMDRMELIKGYRNIISTIYSPREYYQRIDTFLDNYRPTINRRRIGPADVRPFLRSLWRIGLFSRARFQYWKLLTKTLLKRRGSFARAMELAIMGHHFQKVARTVSRSLKNRITEASDVY